MSFGITATNNDGLLLFSGDSYNLVFAGKATYTGQQAFWANEANNYYGSGFLNWPWGELYYYSFNSGGQDAIFLIHAPNGAFSSILTAAKSGSTYSITVSSQPGGQRGAIPSSLIPQVYCFVKQPTAPVAGHGINIFTPTGEVAFSSESNPLIIRAVYDAVYRASGLVLYNDRGITRVGNGPSTGSFNITPTSPLNVVGNISKPIIFFPNHESAAMFAQGVYYFWEIGARFNSSSKALETSWINTFQARAFSGTTFNRAQRVAYAFVADGADYD